MILEVEPIQLTRVHGRRLSCQHDLVATLAAHNSQEFQLMYAHELDFQFDSERFAETGRFGTAIAQPTSTAFDLLSSLYGIDRRYYYFDDFSAEMTLVKSELTQRRPIAVHLDAYFCPWDPFFLKFHNDHVVLICGTTDDFQSVVVTDPYHLKKNCVISTEILRQASKFCIIFERHEGAVETTSWKSLLDQKYGSVGVNRTSPQYLSSQRLIEEFRSGFRHSVEYKSAETFIESELFAALSDLILRRGLFFTAVKHIVSRHDVPELEITLDRIRMMISSLNKVIYDLARNKFEPEFDCRRRVCTELDRHAEIQELTFRDIRRLVSDERETDSLERNSLAFFSDESSLQRTNSIQFATIDLTPHLNNCGFLHRASRSADLSGMGEFLLDMPSGLHDRIEHNELTFQIADSLFSGVDNVACEGQILEFQFGKVQALNILGCGIWGDFFEEMHLRFDSGKSLVRYLKLPSLSSEAIDGCEVAWTGKTALWSGDQLEIVQPNAHLFHQQIVLPNNYGQLLSIKLPICSNLHIFSIVATLAVWEDKLQS